MNGRGAAGAPRTDRSSYAWMGFVAMSFAILGILALFATYAAPLPLERALARDAALDEALDAAGRPDEAARLAALAPRLDDSAGAILKGDGSLPERVRRERSAMRERFLAESERLGRRLRFMILVVTVGCAVFGCVVVGGFSRRDPAS